MLLQSQRYQLLILYSFNASTRLRKLIYPLSIRMLSLKYAKGFEKGCLHGRNRVLVQESLPACGNWPGEMVRTGLSTLSRSVTIVRRATIMFLTVPLSDTYIHRRWTERSSRRNTQNPILNEQSTRDFLLGNYRVRCRDDFAACPSNFGLTLV